MGDCLDVKTQDGLKNLTYSTKVRKSHLDFNAPRVDLQSAHALGELANDLTAKRIQVQAVEARSSVRDRLRSEGVDDKLGGINRFTSVAGAVEAFQKTSP